MSKPTTHRRASRAAARSHRRTIACITAAEAIGELEHGCEIFGLTMGQFSLIDIIEHCLGATGPADVTVSTWTAANADMGFAMSLVSSGAIQSMRFVVDFSFPRRQPEYCSALRERFGDEAIRITKTHAKFVTIRNDKWDVAIRSSMNLNENRRLESFEISDDRGMCDYLGEVVDQLFTEHRPGEQFELSPGRNSRDFDALAGVHRSTSVLGDGELDTDVRRAGWCTAKGDEIK